MGLFRRRKRADGQSEQVPVDVSPTPAEPADSGDDDRMFDDVPRELWPEIDDFTVGAMVDVHNRWNCSIDFDEVYAYFYEEQIERVVDALSQIEGIEHAHQEDREFIVVLTSVGVDFVHSTFLRLMTEELAAAD